MHAPAAFYFLGCGSGEKTDTLHHGSFNPEEDCLPLAWGNDPFCLQSPIRMTGQGVGEKQWLNGVIHYGRYSFIPENCYIGCRSGDRVESGDPGRHCYGPSSGDIILLGLAGNLLPIVPLILIMPWLFKLMERLPAFQRHWDDSW
jgi:hypothetical protein